MEQKDRYTKKELGKILGLKEKVIDFYDEHYAIPGKAGMGILFFYSPDSARFILEREMQVQNIKKTAKTIRKEGSRIIQEKKSLESLIKTAKIMGATMSAKAGNLQYQGSDYTGKISYAVEPTPKLSFCHEKTFRVDSSNEIEEMIQYTKEELDRITKKYGITTRYG